MDITKLNYELTKKPKQKSKKSFGNMNNTNVDLKKLLKEKTINKTSKETYYNMLYGSFNVFRKELYKFFTDKSKFDKEDLVEVFANSKFSKILCNILKDLDQTDNKRAADIIYFTIAEFWLSNIKIFVNDEKLMSRYLQVFAKYEKDKIKKVTKILEVKDKTLALQLVLSSLSFKQATIKQMKSRYTAFLNMIYNLDELSSKQIEKIIKICFGNRSLGIVSFALCERKKNTENFDAVTEALLNILNKQDKDKVKETIKRVANRKRKNPNTSLRVNLLSLDEDEYGKITRTVDKLIDTGMNKQYFSNVK